MSVAFCFDLDGTLSTLEILPCIAAELGVADEISTLTRLTMDGHIPFPDSLRLRALILGQVPIERIHEIISTIPLAESLVDFISEHSERCFVVTGNIDLWIEPLKARLQCKWFSSRARLEAGRVRLDRILDKGDAIQEIRNEGKFNKIAAIGDGANDVPMLRAADFPIAYGGIHAPNEKTTAAAGFVINSPETLCSLLKAL